MKITPFKCETTKAQRDKGVVPGHMIGKQFSQDSGAGIVVPAPIFPLWEGLGEFPSPSLFCVGLVGEIWKAGLELLGMALFADHLGLASFSLGTNCQMREEDCYCHSLQVQILRIS